MAEAGEIPSSWETLQQQIDQLRLENERLTILLTFDELTGLYKTSEFGRRAIIERVQAAMVKGDNVVVGKMDLSNLRGINNAYDHETGDEVLKTVAVKLRELVGLEGLAMRSHAQGDEFGIVIVGQELETVKSMLEKTKSEGIAWKTDNASGKISFTLGISNLSDLTPDERKTPGEVFQNLWQKASLGEREQHRSQNG